jgi:hypothetical protein
MKASNRLLYGLALVKFILPFLLQHPYYELHRDEYLYLAEGQHMSWGYMEVPPLLSVFAWLARLMGNTFFWVKCWPALWGAFTYIVTGKIILSVGGRSWALLLAFLGFVCSAYLRVHFLFQPNFLEIFFWTLITYAVIRYVQTAQHKWLYLAGTGMGLGMESKYTVAIFVAALAVALLLTPQRRIYLNRHLYLAFALGLLLFLPNLLWQYRYGFPVFFHMHELQRTQLQYIQPGDFLKGQLLLLFPCLLIWPAGLVYCTFAPAGKPYRFIAWTYLLVLILLLAAHGKEYYALGIYPVLLALGACYLEQLTSRRTVLRYVLVLIPVLLGAFIVPVLLPVAEPAKLAAYYRKTGIAETGALRWEDLDNHALPQDFADMTGWKEMAAKTGRAYAALSSEEKKHTFLFCDNYGQAGALNFYGKQYGLPQAYSANASFLYWLPPQQHIDHLLLVTDDTAEMSHPFIRDFASATLADSITNPYAVEKGSLIIVLKGANEQFNAFFREKIAKARRYSR